jgi:CheY-like chemotaxis protein
MRDLLDRTIGLMIRIDTELDPGLWAALADANQVESAVLNIAINARDAMPKGGRIVIRTANVAAGTGGLPPELVRADYVSITVTDTGHGMTEEVLAMAFDPFFTTKDVGKGSGLGLSQVYGMVRQSGGTATIDSAPGQGTSVCLFLPRAPGEAQAPSPGTPAETDARREGAAMLVVDNDGEVRSIMAAYLHDAGHQVHQAASGHAALDCVATKAVDVMIVDSFVADMTGTELATRARQKRPDLKVLYITGDAGARVSEAEAVLVKPIRAAQLVAAVDGILEPAREDAAPRGRPTRPPAREA